MVGVGLCCCTPGPTDPVPVTPGDCPIDCTPTSISFWMARSDVAFDGYLCPDCDGAPFEVTLTNTGECGSEIVVGDFILWLSDTNCNGVPWKDSDADYGVAILHCINACYSASFTDTCKLCDDTDSDDAGDFAAYIDYEFRAIVGSVTGSADPVCYLSVKKVFYCSQPAGSCGTVPYRETVTLYNLDMSGGCCGDKDIPSSTDWNDHSCTGFQCEFAPCPAAIGPTVPGHPEYKKITLHC